MTRKKMRLVFIVYCIFFCIGKRQSIPYCKYFKAHLVPWLKQTSLINSYPLSPFFYSPRKRRLGRGGGILVSPCPSVRLSVCLSVCGRDFVQACSRKWVRKLFWKFALITCHLKMWTKINIDGGYFPPFLQAFFLFLHLVVFIITRKSILEIMKNLIKTLVCSWDKTLYLLLVFTIFLMSFANFNSENWHRGFKHTLHAGSTKHSGTVHFFGFLS